MPDGPVAIAPGFPGEPSLAWRSRATTIEGIEQEIARIWAQPSMAGAIDTDGDGVAERHVGARTSVMNLVVVARRPETGERCAATIHGLTGRHPSRTLIVSPADPDGPSWLDAIIQAHCVLASETPSATCAETIYLTCGGESGRHLEAIIAPLLIHDLPVTVWLPEEPPFDSPTAADVFEMCDRLVVDAFTWHGSGLGGLQKLAALQERRPIAISDFALVRQSRWREAIASIFDHPDILPFLYHLRRISVTYGVRDDGDVEAVNIVKPVYHAAWLASRLGMRSHSAAHADRADARKRRRRSRADRVAPPQPQGGDGDRQADALGDAAGHHAPRRVDGRHSRRRAAGRHHRRAGGGPRPRLARRRSNPGAWIQRSSAR